MPKNELKKELMKIYKEKGNFRSTSSATSIHPLADYPKFLSELAFDVSYAVETDDKEFAYQLADMFDDIYDVFQNDDLFYEDEELLQANWLGRIYCLSEVLEGFLWR
jgi:hypothetical protein